ncbi:hypothetical protein [Myroides sp. LJL119]
MKKQLAILLVLLSVFTVVGPVIQWSCQEQSIGFCTMNMDSSDHKAADSCCSPDQSEPMQMMCCNTTSSRVISNLVDLQIQVSSDIQRPESKIAVIKNKWFNSNYLSDLSFVFQGISKFDTYATDAFKYKSTQRQNFLCIYRI